MKKILLSIALLLSVTMIGAQNKTVADAQKAISKAEATAQSKPSSKAFIALADAYLKAYEIPTGNLLLGVSNVEVNALLKGQKPVGSETIVSSENVQLAVDVYSDKKLYYNDNKLEAWIVTAPVADNLLEKAQDALYKAQQLGAKSTDLAKRMEDIHTKLQNEALSYYDISDFTAASLAFENAGKAYNNSILNKIDTLSEYNAAFVANMAKDTDRAIALYKGLAANGIYEEGNVFSNLADIYTSLGDEENCKKTLEDGFLAFPGNQGILIGLINLYMDTKDDTNKIFDLIHKAEQNEPNNASLVKAEGDVYKNLKEFDKAVECYRRTLEIKPDYEYGILSEGVLYYDWAVEIQEAAAAELDDAKYMELNKQFEEVLKKAIEPFEKSFELSTDNEVKEAVAEYLKNVFFRFRDQDPKYMEGYEKYRTFLGSEQ